MSSEKYITEKSKLLKRIGENIRKLRIDHDFTQEYVADKIGVHLNTYQNYESRKPYNIRIFSLYQIAKFYNITTDELIK